MSPQPSPGSRRIRRLIFVYDAASGRLSALADSLKKLVGSGCPLCAVTHGVVKKRSEWEAFEQSLDVVLTYLHSDELGDLSERHPGLVLPCVLAEVEDEPTEVVLLDAAAIARCKGTEQDLQGRLTFRAASLDLILPHH